ncbi:MAG: VWA domain-containing protein [Lachnospiraceae bacterium]|nr:VWA domain-containing protein [Lachnospiraceae bacterium]
MNQTKEEKFNFVLFVACLVGAVIGWVLAQLVYGMEPSSMPVVLRVGVYFAMVFLGIALAALIAELVTSRIKSSWDGSELLKSLLFLLAGTLVFFLLGLFFQFIYGLGYTKRDLADLDDYLIVIDNSGSTDGTDPNNERYSAIESLVSSLDATKRVSVEVFDDAIEGVFSLTEMTDEAKANLTAFCDSMQNADKGGTDIQLVLEDVINNYTPEGRNAAVIFLSDGVSGTALDYSYLSDLYSDKDVPIYCVAFANIGWFGKQTMSKLAESTDGYYYEISELSDFQDALQSMMVLTSTRSLLERRRGSDISNILSTILRILFITILGILVAPALALLLDCNELMGRALLIHIPFSVLAGLFMELLIRLLPVAITRLLMCLLFAVVVTTYMKISFTFTGGDSWDTDYTDPSLTAIKSKTASNLRKKRGGGSGSPGTFG